MRDQGGPGPAPDGDAVSARPLLLWLALAAVTTVLAVALGGGAPQAPSAGLPAAGPLVGWALPLVRLAGHAAALAVVASLLAGVLAGRNPASAGGRVVVAAAVWVAASVGLFVLGLSEVVGRPVPEVLRGDLLLFFARDVPQGSALVRSAAVATLLGVLVPLLARRRGGAAALLGLALLALVPPLLTGHAAGGGDHRLAQAALVLHVLPAVLWVGGLAGLALLRGPTDLARAAAPFSQLALVCAVAVGLSGGLSAYLRLDEPGQLWGTGYGVLVLGKALAFVLLVAAGAWHRRRLLPALRRGATGAAAGAFRRLAIGEVAVMAVTFGLGVTLARTPVG